MGWDYEDAESEYWHVKGMGYSDEDILRMDEWPTMPKYTRDAYPKPEPDRPGRIFREALAPIDYDPAGPGPAPGYFAPDDARYLREYDRTNHGALDEFDQDGTLSASDAARFSRGIGHESPAMKARRQGRESLAAEALRDSRATFAAMLRKEETSPLGTTQKADEIKGKMQMINKSRTIADLKAAILAAQKELALLEKIPSEPGEKLTSFTVTFAGSTKPYIYVGLRINGKWRMSGRHFSGDYTWSGIFERFEAINAKVSYISTPTEFRHEQVYS